MSPRTRILNRAFVNDGDGGFRELTPDDGVEPVLDYGDARIDAVKRKWHEQAFETTTIVSWVPKSLLVEVPGFYPVLKDGKEVGRRSRWVMPDDEAGRAEVQRWFEETHAHLTGEVLTGGHDAVHGVVWNFDESAVHVHWMCDTLAPIHKELLVGADGVMLDTDGEPIVKYKRQLTLDKIVALDDDGRLVAAPEIAAGQVAGIDGYGYLTDADGARLRRTTGEPVRASEDLRVEAQQMWGQSREVTETRVVDGKEKQVQITGATKMRRYQERYRERLIEAGFDIELEVNPRGTSLDKQAFGASETERLEVANEKQALDAERAEMEQKVAFVAAEMERLEAREALIETATTELAAYAGQVEASSADLDRDRERMLADLDALVARAKGLDERAAAIATERAAALAAGRAEGLAAGRSDAETVWAMETEPALRRRVRAEVESAVRTEMKTDVDAAAADRREAANTRRQADAEAARTLAEAAERVEEYEAAGREAADVRLAEYEKTRKLQMPVWEPDVEGELKYILVEAESLGVRKQLLEGAQRRQEVHARVLGTKGQVRQVNQRQTGPQNDQGYGQD
ncbi:MAG: hypothetical protein QM809_10205 [Gordonia sp. (in: high G+C Gram-positive bacteria)]|uniref:hypothetical protein n=1 Tax=Gordonia sp. (in: high G+C Gram-positive bacteria) TaxID=84139 RepID=UPI0039E57F56